MPHDMRALATPRMRDSWLFFFFIHTGQYEVLVIIFSSSCIWSCTHPNIQHPTSCQKAGYLGGQDSAIWMQVLAHARTCSINQRRCCRILMPGQALKST